MECSSLDECNRVLLLLLHVMLPEEACRRAPCAVAPFESGAQLVVRHRRQEELKSRLTSKGYLPGA